MADIALKMAMIMPALLLQKPSKKSTAKHHTQYLDRRLDLWESGRFDELLRESLAIQHNLTKSSPKYEKPEDVAKRFANLMLQGKVHAALKMLDKAESLGVADLTEETLRELKKLHPEGVNADESVLMTGETPYFDPIVFNAIDEEAIAKAALKTRGAAGPSGQDADGWKRMLVSKNYGNAGKDLRTAIAKLAQNLCSREVQVFPGTNKTNIEAYTSCRLIPLIKDPSGGIRPIGIGEVLRRIVGKAILGAIKLDILESAGCLQLCAGQQAGCEAAAHAMGEIFNEEETDAVLFVDAANAFNSLNRKAMVHNMQYLCPPMAMYIKNCYGTPSRLFVLGGKEICSDEGSTQGDPSAMPSYGIGILPFLVVIKPTSEETLKHLAYADDLGGGSKLPRLRQWWDRVVEHGPKFGYFPKPSKSWLVVKEEKLQEAKEIFGDTGVQITTEGRKYLGGFVGTDEGKQNYVKDLCNEWVSQLEELSQIARSEPQAAYAAFTAGFKHKITYFIRTIPNVSETLKPLDEVINNKLLPAITENQAISNDDRRLLSLPVKMGGLGIPIYAECCAIEFENSKKLTENLTCKIVAQQKEFTDDSRNERHTTSSLKAAKTKLHKDTLQDLRSRMTKEQIRANDIAQLKGASAWLTALPLKDEGFVLNKRFDAVALRYRWQLKRLPQYCACGKNFDMDHAMSCMKGGYIHRRHDRIRDLFARVMEDVAHGVRTEPPLQPLSGEILPPGANTEDGARLDIVARDFWNAFAMAFFDIKVFNPMAKSNLNRNLSTVFQENESGKKKAYNARVVRVEHGSFTPVVLSSYGGYGRETSRFVSQLVEKIAAKKNLEKSVVANTLRKKVSFELVRSQIACIRGSRSLKAIHIDMNDASITENVSTIKP